MRYANDPAAFQSGEKMFDFDRGVYAHASVKQALVAAQHRKCCFCESKVTHVAAGDVEHFRPKAGVRQTRAQALQRPGYYWLAYDWGNLFFACEVCNRRAKRNLFPLRDPTARARSHHDDVAREEPLFLHPSHDDPEAHIVFSGALAFPRQASRRGMVTLRALDLNHEDLYHVRFDYLEAHTQMLETLRDALRSPRVSPEDKATARRLFGRNLNALRTKAQRDGTPYAATLRAAVRALDTA